MPVQIMGNAGGTVGGGIFRILAGEGHDGIGNGGEGRLDEKRWKRFDDAKFFGFVHHGLNFEKGREASLFGFFGESGPELKLLEELLLLRITDAPIDIAVPNVFEPRADIFFAREAGHHCGGEIEFDFAVETVEEVVFGFEVGEESAFSDSGGEGDDVRWCV